MSNSNSNKDKNKEKDKDYDDRVLGGANDTALPKPQIEIIVDGNTVFKPGMKTYFVDDYDSDEGKFHTKVMGEYCSCDTVTATYTVCTCQDVCSCDGYQKPTTSTNTNTNTHQVCSCQSVSCGAPCACVPVH